MQSSILRVSQEVAEDIGLTVPLTLFDEARVQEDRNSRKLRRAALQTGRFLWRYWDWPDLQFQFDWTTTGGAAGHSVALPSNFGRLVRGSVANRTEAKATGQPVALSRFQDAMRAGEPALTMMRGRVWLTTPTAVSYAMSLFYVSANWVRADAAPEGENNAAAIVFDGQGITAGQYKDRFTLDTDRAIWPDELMHLAMVWAVKSADGDGTPEEYAQFLGQLHEFQTAISDSDVLDMGGGEIGRLSPYPDTPWAWDG